MIWEYPGAKVSETGCKFVHIIKKYFFSSITLYKYVFDSYLSRQCCNDKLLNIKVVKSTKMILTNSWLKKFEASFFSSIRTRCSSTLVNTALF